MSFSFSRALLGAMFAATGLTAAPARAQQTFDFAVWYSDRDYYAPMTTRWAKQVEDVTEGRVRMKLHFSGSLVPAKDTVADTVLGLQAGADDYLKKPFHFDELLERIRVQLRPTAASAERFSLGPIVLDVGAHRVQRHGEEVVLTQKEFALLEYLMRHKGKVCRRQAIIEQVWDIHFEYNSGVIDVYMNALRKKLNLTKDDECLQTIRGIGYVARD